MGLDLEGEIVVLAVEVFHEVVAHFHGFVEGGTIADAADGDADAIAAIDEVFPANPGMMCAWCDFRRWCPSGQDASEVLQPWDGLARTANEEGAD